MTTCAGRNGEGVFINTATVDAVAFYFLLSSSLLMANNKQITSHQCTQLPLKDNPSCLRLRCCTSRQFSHRDDVDVRRSNKIRSFLSLRRSISNFIVADKSWNFRRLISFSSANDDGDSRTVIKSQFHMFVDDRLDGPGCVFFLLTVNKLRSATIS